jgi:hypothetical protein
MKKIIILLIFIFLSLEMTYAKVNITHDNLDNNSKIQSISVINCYYSNNLDCYKNNYPSYNQQKLQIEKSVVQEKNIKMAGLEWDSFEKIVVIIGVIVLIILACILLFGDG